MSRANCISCVTTIMVMPSSAKLAHDAQDFVAQLRVQRAGRLVEKHHFRFHGQGAGDGDALLLAAGKLGRIGSGFVAQADFGQQSASGSFRFRTGETFDHPRRLGDVLQDGQMRKQIERLENHAGLHPQTPLPFPAFRVARRASAVNGDVADGDAAGVGDFKLVQAAQEKCSCRSRWGR